MRPRPSYYATLLEVREEIMARLELAQAVLDWPDYFLSSHESFISGVPYGEQVRTAATLASLKGHGTRKCAHAIVDRCASGRYELTFYIA